MPRNEHRNTHSMRPYRPEQVATDQMLHRRKEEERKRSAKSDKTVYPWEDPNFVPSIIEPEEVVEKTYSRRSAPPPSREVQDKKHRSRLLEAIDLKTTIELLSDVESRIDPAEAHDRYAEDLEMAESLIIGLRTNPEDGGLIQRIQELEARYLPRH